MNPGVMSQTSLSLLLIDDHQIYLDGLSMSLSLMEQVGDVYQATCLDEALAVLDTVTPDVILLDLNLPQADGFEIMTHLKKKCPEASVIILSGSDQPDDIRLAISRGAAGFLSKSANGDEIQDAIYKVVNGETLKPVLSAVVETPDSDDLLSQVRLSVASQHRITPRQAEVLVLLGEGLSNKLICRRLDLTEATVKFHLKALFQTLEVHNRTECVTVARKLKILL